MSSDITVELSLCAMILRGMLHNRADGPPLEKISVSLPRAECMEIRPDWGVYYPILTFPAIERALRSRGYLPYTPPSRAWWYGVKRETTPAQETQP